MTTEHRYPHHIRLTQPSPDDLERRLFKLSKINAALMQRVERSMDQQANAYSLFQTAIALESEVKLRTEQLKSALGRLERTNEELVAARDAAERANRFKTRFFTAVGHDLLQPLHAARLSLSALAEADEATPHRRLADQIDHALLTVEQLLKSILDISKLDAGMVEPRIVPVALDDLFNSLALDLTPLARKKGLLLTTRPTRLAVRTDPMMMRRILQNLLANAVQYTDRGRILLAARPHGDTVRIDVIDTGPGIPPSERDRIFEEFQRGEASAQAVSGGFGLGLSIVQRMAEALDHPISLASNVGRGTRFSVSAPHADPALVEVTPPPAVTSQQAYGFSGTRILVLDNDAQVLQAMRTLLERWSCPPTLATSLADVDRLIATETFAPDIVLADYHLDNGACGLTAVARVRERWGAHVPAVVVTADHSAEIAEKARRAGCEILCKPVRPAELRALIQHLKGEARSVPLPDQG